MKRELINTIKIDAANFEFIAKTGKINGTLLIEIERVMTEYARNQANGDERSSDECHIQNVTHSAYQLCPKCNGQGIVSKPPWVAGDVYEWSSTQSQFTCDVCNGAKIIPQHCG